MKKYILIFAALLLLAPAQTVCGASECESQLSEFTDSLLTQINTDELDVSDEDGLLFSLTGYNSSGELLKAIAQGEYSLNAANFIKIASSLFLQSFNQYKYIIPTVAFQCILYSVITGIGDGYLSANLKKATFCAVYVSLATTVAGAIFKATDYSTDAITKLSDFMNTFITVFFMLIFAGGSSVSASVINPLMLGFSSLASKLILSVIIPVSQAAFLLSLSGKIISNMKLTNFKNFIKKTSYFLLGACFSIFGIIISFEGITFASIDMAGINTVKYAVSTLIPVVGKFISESTDVIGGFMLIIKNSLGLVGAVLVGCIVFAPVMKIFTLFLIMRGCSILAEPLCSAELASVLEEGADFLFFINICVLSCSVMMIVLIGIMMLIGKNMIPH